MSDTKKTTRRELLHPVQLLGFAFLAAVVAGVVAAVSLGILQAPRKPGMTAAAADQLREHIFWNALSMSGIVAGITFIVVLLLLSMMLLAIKPSDFDGDGVSQGVLLPESADAADATADGSEPQSQS